ncbi:MAG: roadblock/LC7 domain-containing protein [Rhodobacteraceae bacterium]|nr:roadblock/LC7 domain-containing protein [Paracoccaceae bacterium]
MSTDISKASEIEGFIGACLVDSDSGLMVNSLGGGGVDLEAVAAMYTQVVQSNIQTVETLDLETDIEDIFITLGNQHHIIRPLRCAPSVFLFVAVKRAEGNVGMARIQVRNIESKINI